MEAGKETFSKLPDGWKWQRLEDALDFVIGGDWGKDENFNDPNYGEAYCIRGAEIKNWNEEKGRTASLRKIKLSNIEKRRLIEGDILVEISGGGPEQPVGRTVLIDKSVLSYKPDVPKICTNFLRLIRPKDFVESKFLNLYLKLFYHSGEIVKYQAGSNNLRNLKFPDYVRINFPLPPKEVQQQIVSKIEELFSELDKGIEELKTAQQQLKVYRQAVLKWAFEGKLTESWRKESCKQRHPDSLFWDKRNNKFYELGYEINTIPSNWLLFPIGNVFDFQQGMQIAKKSRLNSPMPNSLPILRIKNYKDKFQTDVEYIEVDESSLIAEKEDIIMTRTGESRGDILTGFKGVFHNNTFRINYPKDKMERSFLIYYLSSSKVQNYIKNKSGRTGQPDLTHRNFGPCPVIIPPLEEQQQITQEIESRLSVCDKIEETIADSLKQSEALRQSILKKAFEGKLG